MGKIKEHYICNNCGHTTLKWYGRCPNCGSWNSMEETRVKRGKDSFHLPEKLEIKPISEIQSEQQGRISTRLQEMDRVLGGGIVPGSLVLIGGDPGIGKSTLLMQLGFQISRNTGPVLYFSGEESPRQLKIRAQRLNALDSRFLVCSEINVFNIERIVRQKEPVLVIVDSIQTLIHPELESAPGSVNQIREATNIFLRLAKDTGIPVFLVGHVTKGGIIAGPRVLEHMVDTVLYMEGDSNFFFRILRSVKNRFGSTNELAIFKMEDRGLVEVKNPSRALISERPCGVSGSVIVPCMEGTRPLLIELQALVTRSIFGQPQRVTAGVDHKRLSLLLAVLEKRCGIFLLDQDVHLNIAGGLKIDEPALDLGMVAALVSSFQDRSLPSGLVVLGEVGLAGEIRAVSRIEPRLREAEKLGFDTAVIPRGNCRSLEGKKFSLKIAGVENLAEAISCMIGGE